jgi:hypothetical protein
VIRQRRRGRAERFDHVEPVAEAGRERPSFECGVQAVDLLCMGQIRKAGSSCPDFGEDGAPLYGRERLAGQDGDRAYVLMIVGKRAIPPEEVATFAHGGAGLSVDLQDVAGIAKRALATFSTLRSITTPGTARVSTTTSGSR